MFGVNPLDFDGSRGNVRAEVMILNTNVFGTRAKFGGIGQFYTTSVIFVDSRMSYCIANNQLCDLGEFMKEVPHRDEITSRLGHGNVFRFRCAEGNLRLKFRAPEDGT